MINLILTFVLVSSQSGTEVTTNTYSFDTVAACNAAVNNVRIQDQNSEGTKVYKVGSYTNINQTSALGGRVQRVATTTAFCKG